MAIENLIHKYRHYSIVELTKEVEDVAMKLMLIKNELYDRGHEVTHAQTDKEKKTFMELLDDAQMFTLHAWVDLSEYNKREP